MLALWRLSTSALAARRKRTVLIVAAVALATALITVVAVMMGSLNDGLRRQVAATLGNADLRVKHAAGAPFDPAVLARVEALPGVALAAPRAVGAVALSNPLKGVSVTVEAYGGDPAREAALVEPRYSEGREPRAAREIVLDPQSASKLEAVVGTELMAKAPTKDGEPAAVERPVTVVGVLFPDPIKIRGKPNASLTMDGLAALIGETPPLQEIRVQLGESVDPEAAARDFERELPADLMVLQTARVTSGIDVNIRANTMIFSLVTTLAYIASGFIILTGLTTNLLEQQRELAILRAVGGTRAQLALMQLITGGVIGALGAMVGVPLGMALAELIFTLVPDQVPRAERVPWESLLASGGGAILSGLLGALMPALEASRVSPLRSLGARARVASARGIIITGLIGAAFIALDLFIISVPTDPSVVFWTHITLGVPLTFLGYFLLGVPLVVALARVIAPVLSLVLRLPRGMLSGAVRATPYRHGFTAGALMVGLAMMTTIWTNGNAVLRDWLGAIQFPDAFVHAWFGLNENAQKKLAALPFVTDTCATTLYKIDTKAFGLEEVRNPPSFFIAFEPESFFRMVKLHWEAGDPAYAQRRIKEGGAAIVAKEFLATRRGFKIGDTLSVTTRGTAHTFEIVGAVSSPGLDVVGAYMDIGRDYNEQAVWSIFGSRDDLKKVFGSDAIHLIQFSMIPGISDLEATTKIKKALGLPTLTVGTGRFVKNEIETMALAGMSAASAIAIGAMLIGSLGVAGVILAAIDARRHEFGVLRAIGAPPGLLARLLISETLIMALAASVLGTALGLHGSAAAMRMWELLAGLKVSLRPPLLPIGAGWALLIGVTLIVVTPMILRVSRTKPRELLASTRG